MIKNNIGDLAPRLPEDKSLRGALAHDELLHNFCTSENFRVENEEVYYDLDDPEDNPYPFYEGLHKGLANQILHEEFSIQDKNYANTPNDPGKLLDPIEVEMDAENIVQQKKIRFLYNSVETNYLSYANSDHDIKSIKYSNDRENPNATTYDNAQKPPDFLPIIDELFSNYTMSDLVEALGTHSVWHMMMWKAQYFLEKFDLDNLKSTIHYVTDNINAISGDPEFTYRFVGIKMEYNLAKGQYQTVLDGLTDIDNGIYANQATPPSIERQILFIEFKMQALYALKRYDEVLAALQDIPAYLTDYMLDHKEFQIMESLKDWKKRILHAKASLPSHELQKKKNKMDEPLLQKEFDSMKAKIDELYESGSYDEALFVLENTPRNLEDYILDHPKVMQNIKSLKKKLLDDKELRGGKRVVPRIDENVKNEIQHLKDKADEAFVQGEYDYALALIQETISRFDDDILDRPKIVARFSHLRDIILQAKSESSPEALAKVKSSDSVESRGVTKQIDKFNELIKLEKYNEALNLNKRIVSDFENYLSSHPEVAKILKDGEKYALEDKGLLFFKKGEYVQAEKLLSGSNSALATETLSKILSLLEQRGESTLSESELLLKGKILYDLKRYVVAEEFLSKLLERYPDNGEIMDIMGRVITQIKLSGSKTSVMIDALKV